jgi:cytochrome c
MKAKGGVWNPSALDTYLKQPMMAVPGTRMAFAGIPDDADRKALILYLEAQSK